MPVTRSRSGRGRALLAAAFAASSAAAQSDDLEEISASNAPDASCASGGLAITDPVATAAVSGQSHPFLIAGVAQMEVRLGIPELPVPGAPATTPRTDGGLDARPQTLASSTVTPAAMPERSSAPPTESSTGIARGAQATCAGSTSVAEREYVPEETRPAKEARRTLAAK